MTWVPSASARRGKQIARGLIAPDRETPGDGDESLSGKYVVVWSFFTPSRKTVATVMSFTWTRAHRVGRIRNDREPRNRVWRCRYKSSQIARTRSPVTRSPSRLHEPNETGTGIVWSFFFCQKKKPDVPTFTEVFVLYYHFYLFTSSVIVSGERVWNTGVCAQVENRFVKFKCINNIINDFSRRIRTPFDGETVESMSFFTIIAPSRACELVTHAPNNDFKINRIWSCRLIAWLLIRVISSIEKKLIKW